MILSDIEQRIKAKIEAIGTPLKDWDISINYGIKTGFNDAFIIDGEKRAELTAQDPKSEEIIRPILRGRDIKKYGYEWNDKYVIIARLESDIPNKYPAICKHLELFKGKGKLGDNSTTKVFKRPWWAWMQEPVSYWEDFSKQKIMYSEIVREPQFYLDNEGEFLAEATTFIMTGNNLEYLYHLLHSKIITYFFKTFYAGGGLGGDGYRYKKAFLEKLPIPKNINNMSLNQNNVEDIVNKIYQLSEEEIAFIKKL